MENILGRELPEFIEGYGEIVPYDGNSDRAIIKSRITKINESDINDGSKLLNPIKLLNSIKEALNKVQIKNGMTVSFHHHLRNGDYVLNLVMKAIEEQGIKNITVAMSSIFPIHEPLVDLIKNGTITGIVTSYVTGPVAKAISLGYLQRPAIMQTHGGRARAIESGDLHIDVAFIAAPTADSYGNINGMHGKSACGVLGYAIADSEYADKVIVITDNLVPYPAYPIEISQINVDYVVEVDSIGNPEGIVSGTTKITRDPVGLKVAKMAAEAMKASGLIKEGLSFQTGAGGTSLAVAAELRSIMVSEGIKGSFASGGINGYLVDMFKEGLFQALFDVQCFDLQAVESCGNNMKHQRMSASMYGNPHNKGAVVNNLDIVILGATEIDLNFNVNVTTGSDGFIMGGSGGHSDTAAGAKLVIVVSNLLKARLCIVKDKVITITTPGANIDVLVTERGIAVNPKRQDLIEKFKSAKLPVVTINELKEIAERLTGKPEEIEMEQAIVALVEYRDGTVIDVIRKVMSV